MPAVRSRSQGEGRIVDRLRSERRCKGKRFESIEEQNAYLLHWNERWALHAHPRHHQTPSAGDVRRRAAVTCCRCRRRALNTIALLSAPFTSMVSSRSTGAYYHAPPHYVGTKVIVHIGRLWIRIIDPRTHQLLREHAVTGKGQRRIVEADLPEANAAESARSSRSRSRISAHPARSSPELSRTSAALLAARTLFGVLDLARRYGSDAARTRLRLRCRGSDAGASAFSRTYLAHHSDHDAHDAAQDHPGDRHLRAALRHFSRKEHPHDN